MMVVRKSLEPAITKWYGNKSVLMASIIHENDPEDACTRWPNKEKVHVQVRRPTIVTECNDNRCGVDLCDRVLGF